MLALASLLVRLRDDPETVGKRYQLTVRLNPFEVDAVERIPGVADASERYQSDVADAFRLGEPLRVVAYPGDHTRFEAPPLAEGRRLRSDGEAEVGVGLADALGLRPGATLAVQGQGGDEARFRVVGVVRALERDGRIAYVRPRPAARRAARRGRVDRGPARARRRPRRGRARSGGARRAAAAGDRRRRAATRRSSACSPRCCAAVGLAIGLVCLYALVQALAMTARERRGAIALLRASGADATTVALVLAGAALAVAVPAAIAGVLLEWLVLGPLVARLAAGYADAAARARARPGAARRSAACCCSPRPRRRWSPAARCASRSSRGCGRSDGARRRRPAPRWPRCSPAAAATGRPRRRTRPSTRRSWTATATARWSRGPGEPLATAPTSRRPRGPAPSSPRSPRSPTPTCATRSRRRASRSSTASAARSRPRSGRRRRSARRCSPPPCAPSTASRPTRCS